MTLRSFSLALASCLLFAITLLNFAVSAQTEPSRVEISAKRFAFTPSDITLHRGEPVVLVFKSEDVTHGIHFDDLNLEATIDKKTSVEVPFTPQKTGVFVGHCANFCGAGHGAMMLTIHVVE
ncbi:MAG: cupredoxin domain-containing protein [Granulicella sp.]